MLAMESLSHSGIVVWCLSPQYLYLSRHLFVISMLFHAIFAIVTAYNVTMIIIKYNYFSEKYNFSHGYLEVMLL